MGHSLLSCSDIFGLQMWTLEDPDPELRRKRKSGVGGQANTDV